jgi:hypothetical protein
MLTDAENWLLEVAKTRKKAVDSLSREEKEKLEDLYSYDNFLGIQEFLLEKAKISDDEKNLLKTYWEAQRQ